MLVAEIIWCINATHTVYTRNNDATVFQMGSLSRVTVHTSKVVMDDYILLDILNKKYLISKRFKYIYRKNIKFVKIIFLSLFCFFFTKKDTMCRRYTYV